MIEGPIQKETCTQRFMFALGRLGLTILSAVPAAIPAATLKLKTIKNPVLLMFTNIAVPIVYIAFMMQAGPVDWLVAKVKMCADSNYKDMSFIKEDEVKSSANPME